MADEQAVENISEAIANLASAIIEVAIEDLDNTDERHPEIREGAKAFLLGQDDDDGQRLKELCNMVGHNKVTPAILAGLVPQ